MAATSAGALGGIGLSWHPVTSTPPGAAQRLAPLRLHPWSGPPRGRAVRPWQPAADVPPRLHPDRPIVTAGRHRVRPAPRGPARRCAGPRGSSTVRADLRRRRRPDRPDSGRGHLHRLLDGRADVPAHRRWCIRTWCAGSCWCRPRPASPRTPSGPPPRVRRRARRRRSSTRGGDLHRAVAGGTAVRRAQAAGPIARSACATRRRAWRRACAWPARAPRTRCGRGLRS